MDKKTREYKNKENRTPWSKLLRSIKTRCNNPKSISYKYYGGRGIENHLTKEDIKRLWNRDAKNLVRPSIDRIDNDGNYTYDNCRFIEFIDNIRRKDYSFNSLRKRNSRGQFTSDKIYEGE